MSFSIFKQNFSNYFGNPEASKYSLTLFIYLFLLFMSNYFKFMNKNIWKKLKKIYLSRYKNFSSGFLQLFLGGFVFLTQTFKNTSRIKTQPRFKYQTN